jgi:23S rRNA (pseudouridine1915-N3)-methyltransferase
LKNYGKKHQINGSQVKISLIAVGCKMPSWVDATVKDYQKRLPRDWQWDLIEIPSVKRDKVPASKVIEQEGSAILQKLKNYDFFISLDRCGKPISSEQLATTMQDWNDNSWKVAIIIGGPEGICPKIRAKARSEWSISELTLPHPLVRVIMAEQLFRAWSITKNHPYHRGSC